MKTISVGEPPQQGWGQTIALDPRHGPMIARLEQFAARDADGYRRRVVAAGLVAYVVLTALLALLVGLTVLMVILIVTTGKGAAVALKFAFVFGALAFGLVRALWVPRVAPDGIALSASESPDLFAMVDRVRCATGGPPIHAIRLTDQMNAAITQEARFVIVGARNTLYLGLPLLQALTPDEVAGVIAHEFGHFVGKHGHSSGFVYRIRRRWAQIAERMPDGIVSGLLRRFFRWYGPWFASYSFVLARQQEYEADAVAARATSAETIANALIRITVQSVRYGSAWSAIWSQSVERDDPPASPHDTAASVFQMEDDADRDVLDRELRAEADLDDTHPTLAQRLHALGRSATLPPPLATPAVTLLGPALPLATTQFDAEWHDWADDVWKHDYRERQEERAEQAALAERITVGETEREALYRHAWLTERLDGAEPAARAYAIVLRHHPDAQDARFRYGDMLLDLYDEAGTAILLEAGHAEPGLLPHAYRRIIDFRRAQGRDAEAYLPLLAQAEAAEALATAEANAIDETARLRAADEALRERVSALVADVEGVAALHVAVRDLTHTSKPQTVFVFTAAHGYTGVGVLDRLVDAMLPAGDLIGIEMSRSRRWLTKRIKALPNSRIIDRKQSRFPWM